MLGNKQCVDVFECQEGASGKECPGVHLERALRDRAAGPTPQHRLSDIGACSDCFSEGKNLLLIPSSSLSAIQIVLVLKGEFLYPPPTPRPVTTLLWKWKHAVTFVYQSQHLIRRPLKRT